MFIDKLFEFADGVSLTASGQIGNVVDLLQDRDIGPGRPLWLVLSLPEAPESDSADETYVVALQTDDNEAFASAVELASVTILRSESAGDRHVIGFPLANERYLRLYGTVGGTIGGTGLTLDAWITDQHPAAWQAYPDAI